MPRLPICLNPDDPKQNFENDNLDFCKGCWDLHIRSGSAEHIHDEIDVEISLIERALEVEDTASGCEHPDYDDTDYRCQICDKKLSSEDE